MESVPVPTNAPVTKDGLEIYVIIFVHPTNGVLIVPKPAFVRIIQFVIPTLDRASALKDLLAIGVSNAALRINTVTNVRSCVAVRMADRVIM